jgi:hypothetical protein
MRTSKIAVMFVSMVFTCCSAASPQQTISPALLTDLKANDWMTRQAAYAKIKVNQEALKLPDAKGALVDLLDRETQVSHTTRAESNGQISVSDKYGEGYTAYTRDLQATVANIADWHDEHQLCVLARSSYNPDWGIASKLAVQGGAAIVPCLLAMAQSNDENDRYESIPVLVQLSAVTNDLSPSARQQVQQVIATGLRDSSVGVRLATVGALARFGTAEMIPFLQNVARSDPASRRLDNGQQRFSVRDAAAGAIQSIQGRQRPK